MLNYVKQRVRERGNLRGKVTIRGGDQEGHDGDDGMFWPVRSCLTLREASKPSNARKHHLANMWIWFNAGLLPVAALLHTGCVSQDSLFYMQDSLYVFFSMPCSLLGVEQFRRQPFI